MTNRKYHISIFFSCFQTIVGKIIRENPPSTPRDNDQIRELKKIGSGADVVSVGELIKSIKAGINSKKIVFSGIGKTEEEIKKSDKRDPAPVDMTPWVKAKEVSIAIVGATAAIYLFLSWISS